jgi:hypothetical protein
VVDCDPQRGGFDACGEQCGAARARYVCPDQGADGGEGGDAGFCHVGEGGGETGDFLVGEDEEFGTEGVGGGAQGSSRWSIGVAEFG